MIKTPIRIEMEHHLGDPAWSIIEDGGLRVAVGLTKSDAEQIATLVNGINPDSGPDLLVALKGLMHAVDRQFSMSGKGIQRSPRVEEAFAAAEAAVAQAERP